MDLHRYLHHKHPTSSIHFHSVDLRTDELWSSEQLVLPLKRLFRQGSKAIRDRDGLLLMVTGLRNPDSDLIRALFLLDGRLRARGNVLNVAIAGFEMDFVSRLNHLMDRSKAGLHVGNLRSDADGLVVVSPSCNGLLPVLHGILAHFAMTQYGPF